MSEAKVHPSLLKRKIIHLDMDAFFASIEMRDNPKLRDKALAVGGQADRRGVIATCNYEARKYGVRSAMASAAALRLCPHLVLVPPRFQTYKEVSNTIHSILKSFSEAHEPLSLDEAYIDVTQVRDQTASKLALRVKNQIYQETQLTSSTGVAPNKMLAKIASDIRKPNGITIVTPGQAFDFMQSLPLAKIPGVGPKSADRLRKHGLVYCRDALRVGESYLKQAFGPRFGHFVFERSQGIDTNEVSSQRGRKSVGAAKTYPEDLYDLSLLSEELEKVLDELVGRLKSSQLKGRCVSLKVKYKDLN